MIRRPPRERAWLNGELRAVTDRIMALRREEMQAGMAAATLERHRDDLIDELALYYAAARGAP